MNDLYTQDRMTRNNDDFDGSGAASGHYTPQEEFKEKLGEIKLPAILFVFASLCFAIVIFLTVQEVVLVSTGSSINATVTGASGYFKDENGNSHVVDVSWASSKNRDGTITVYYKDHDYVHAQPRTSLLSYILAYLFFGGLIGLDIFWMYKILHKTKHTEKAGFSSDGYRSKFDE